MSEHGTITSSGATANTTFVLYSGIHGNGIPCDLSGLITDGAKFDVLLDQMRKVWNAPRHPGKTNDWVYYRLYHAVERWNNAGIVEKLSGYLHSLYPGLTQKRGIFVRATAKANQKQPCLINDLQNSKSFAEAQKRPQLDQTPPPRYSPRTCRKRAAEYAAALTATEPYHPLDKYNNIPGRCGFWRSQAIRVSKSINRYELFIRDKNGHLPAELQLKIKQQILMFEEWKRETEHKIIVLKKITGDGTYVTIPCSTRFTDDSRKKQLVLAYNTGVENSLKKHTFATFATFTTDPLIWTSPEGQKITRKIPDPHIDKVHKFSIIGKGGNEFTANRHESTAFRKWYETECHRVGKRIPYLRCVEFQENGLIHEHIMLFDYAWEYTFAEFGKQWGTKYGQGIMHDVYSVISDGEKWTWKTNKPADTQGRSPADYLKKYLIKALYDESGHYAYWVTNKRFFTMSKSLRYLTEKDEIKQKLFLKEHESIDRYEYIGAVPAGHEKAAIAADIRQREGLRPTPPNPVTAFTAVKTKHDIINTAPPHHWYVPPESLEDPDENDPLEIHPESLPDPEEANRGFDRTEYDRLLAEETRLMEERRKKLKERSG